VSIVIEVIGVLGLLALTPLMMFLVTVFGAGRPGPNGTEEFDRCIVCEDQDHTAVVGNRAICRSCAAAYVHYR
jgi:hypothetical protein